MNRIRIAPALPSHLKEFRVRGIRVGDASLELAYGRAGPVHSFRLDAMDGRVPPMVVLEPSLPLAGGGRAPQPPTGARESRGGRASSRSSGGRARRRSAPG